MKTHQKLCPSCGSELVLLGSHGLRDPDGKWPGDTQADKYRCKRGQHITFLVSAYDIDEEERTPWVEAWECIYADIEDAKWAPGEVTIERDYEYKLPAVTCCSLEDLRSEVAKRAVATFDGAKAKDPKYNECAYDFIEALSDVDNKLQDYARELAKAGWATKAHDSVGGGSSTPPSTRGGK
jgi:hypothetical protein